jgi:hypothetical protein
MRSLQPFWLSLFNLLGGGKQAYQSVSGSHLAPDEETRKPSNVLLMLPPHEMDTLIRSIDDALGIALVVIHQLSQRQ